jgi:hypothetical protein
MKKIIALIAALAMLTAVFTGCGGSGDASDNTSAAADTQRAETSASLTKVLETVNKAYPDQTEGVSLYESADDLKKYYNINTEDVKQFAGEIDKVNSSIEIVLVEAVDSEALGRVKSALDARYNQLKSNGASYDAEQLEMVKNCSVTTKDNYVLFIISDEYDGIYKLVDSAL